MAKGKRRKVDADRRPDLGGPERSRHVVGRGIGEDERLQGQRLHVAGRAADRVELLRAFGRRGAPVVRQVGFHGRRRQRRLEGDQRRDVALRHRVGHAALGEVVASRPAHAEALDRLHPVMDVEGVDGELPERGEDALAAERAHDEVGVDAVDRIEIDHPVRMRDDPAEAHALADEVRPDLGARGAGALDRVGANGLQVRGHLARQKLDEAGAHQRDRMALARERGVGVVELGALEPLRNEDVGDVVARAALDRIVVAAEAGVRVGAAGAAERRVDAGLALGRDDGLGRLRPARAVDRGELRLEQDAPALDQRRKRRRAGGGDRVEIDMRAGSEDALVPAASRRRARRQNGERAERDGCSQGSFHVSRLADGTTDRWLLFVTGRAGAARAIGGTPISSMPCSSVLRKFQTLAIGVWSSSLGLGQRIQEGVDENIRIEEQAQRSFASSRSNL